MIARYPAGRQQSAVIPILWRAQEQEGWVTRPAIEAVAQMLGMAYIRVLEVATFYTQFLLKPVGANAHIIVCGTTPCMLRGAGDLLEICQHKIAHDPLEVSADGKLSWEEVECLGACVNAPMIMIGNDTYEDLTVERFEEIVEAFGAGNGKSIKPGTQIKRQFSARRGRRDDAARNADRRADLQGLPRRHLRPARPRPGAPHGSRLPRRLRPPRPTLMPEPSQQAVARRECPGPQGPAGPPKVSEAKAEGERTRPMLRPTPMATEPRHARERHRRRVAPPARSMAARPRNTGPRKAVEAPAGPADA